MVVLAKGRLTEDGAAGEPETVQSVFVYMVSTVIVPVHQQQSRKSVGLWTCGDIQ